MLKNKDGLGAKVTIRLTAEYVCGGKWGKKSHFSKEKIAEIHSYSFKCGQKKLQCTYMAGSQRIQVSFCPHFGPATTSILSHASTMSCQAHVGIFCFYDINSIAMMLIKWCLPLQGPRRQKGFFDLSWFQPQHWLPKVKLLSRPKVHPFLPQEGKM